MSLPYSRQWVYERMPKDTGGFKSNVVDAVSPYRSSIDPADPDLLAFNKRMKNSGYDDIVNPYLNYNYQNSLWDFLGDAFGFSTYQDQLALDMQIKAKEFMSNISKERFDNEFNSPDQQAARMRAAGMNPDLQGTGNVAGASQFDQPMPGVSYDPTEDTKTFGASLGSAFQAAMSLAQFGTTLPMALQNIQTAEVDRTDKIFNIATKVASGLSPDVIQEVLFKDISKERFDELFGDVLPWNNSKNRSSFLTALRTSIKQPKTQGESFKGRSILGQNMKELSDLETSSWFNWSYNTLNIIRQPLVKMQDTLTGLNLEYNVQKGYADFQNEVNRMNYLNKAAELGLPENTARAEYDEALSRQHTAKYNSCYAKFKQSVLNQLHQDAETNPFSRFLEFCWLTGFTPNPTTGVAYGLNMVPGEGVVKAVGNAVKSVKTSIQDKKRNKYSKDTEAEYSSRRRKKREPRHGKRGKVAPYR